MHIYQLMFYLLICILTRTAWYLCTPFVQTPGCFTIFSCLTRSGGQAKHPGRINLAGRPASLAGSLSLREGQRPTKKTRHDTTAQPKINNSRSDVVATPTTRRCWTAAADRANTPTGSIALNFHGALCIRVSLSPQGWCEQKLGNDVDVVVFFDDKSLMMTNIYSTVAITPAVHVAEAACLPAYNNNNNNNNNKYIIIKKIIIINF